MTVRFAVLLTTVVGLASSANADLAFSFADPVNGRQMTNTQNNIAGPGTGEITYDRSANLDFLVDGSTEPTPFASVFNGAHMEMSIIIGTAVPAGPNLFVAPVLQGSFFRIITAGGATILRGDALGGAFVRFGGTQSILLSDITFFSYTFGAALQALLDPGRAPANPQEGTFTVTDILTAGGPLIGAGGVINSFQSNASFSGNVGVVPTPGAMALVAIGGVLTSRRRRA